ncbi:hypothetical protein D3OALGB2SA_3992 [Olavius algarvensis associated proteobacterium Delta 3]|nr:hypothetical protein D3OALGB2SA_3992 [Olavius algarvensis associated proteobacterium Delta 3]
MPFSTMNPTHPYKSGKPPSDQLTETSPAARKAQVKKARAYYRVHSKFYDLTRWPFLFGRRRLASELPYPRNARIDVAEVGCGTGIMLRQIAGRYPNARLAGYDVSGEMLAKARRKLRPFHDRVTLHEGNFSEDSGDRFVDVDVILFSYSLSLINPQWQTVVMESAENLKKEGMIAVVDFHDSPHISVKRYFAGSHVKMDGHLYPFLQRQFTAHHHEHRWAYGNLWSYFLFIGSPKSSADYLSLNCSDRLTPS